MNIDELQKAIEYGYKERNIKKRRYSALDKVIVFFKYTFQCTDDTNFILQIKKEELKRIYKATNNAENQAINDIYNYLTNQITPIKFLQESQIENTFEIQVNKHIKEGLAPWIGKNPKVLILGTMPSDASTEQQSYYSNPSNSFWKIMYSLFPKKENQNKKEYITSHGIALWDCAHSGIRNGSVDSGFIEKSIIPNNLKSFLKQYPSIKTIILNGKSRGSKKNVSPQFIIRKYFSPNDFTIPIIPLGSTSNLNGNKNKIQEWSILKDLVK